MYKGKRMIVTTTSNLQNCEINRYLGLISARVVAGTWFFSDFLASFSDSFGGRSGSYQKQLQKINEQAIEELKEEASKIGANAIIGVRIDHDQISGKSKQMFMVTATGTTVVVKQVTSDITRSEMKDDTIPLDEFEVEMEKNDLIKDIKSDKWEVKDEELWTFVIDNRIHEVASDILEKVGKLYLDYDSYMFKPYREKLMKFFGNLDITTSKNILYSSIEEGTKIGKLCLEIIDELDFLDLNLASKLISADNFEVRKIGLSILNCDKQIYTKDDVDKLQSMKEVVISKFPNLGQEIEEDKWLCQCGKKNKKKHIYCKSCRKNIKGLEESDTKPEEVVDLIERRLEVLRKIFH